MDLSLCCSDGPLDSDAPLECDNSRDWDNRGGAVGSDNATPLCCGRLTTRSRSRSYSPTRSLRPAGIAAPRLEGRPVPGEDDEDAETMVLDLKGNGYWGCGRRGSPSCSAPVEGLLVVNELAGESEDDEVESSCCSCNRVEARPDGGSGAPEDVECPMGLSASDDWRGIEVSDWRGSGRELRDWRGNDPAPP